MSYLTELQASSSDSKTWSSDSKASRSGQLGVDFRLEGLNQRMNNFENYVKGLALSNKGIGQTVRVCSGMQHAVQPEFGLLFAPVERT